MDYDALAKEFGGSLAQPTGSVDLAALAEQFGGVADIPLASVPEQAIQNLPASAAKFAGDIYTAVTNPVQTVTGLADLAAGGVRAGAKRVLPEAVFNFIDQVDNPETTARISAVANAVGGQLAEDYGSIEGIKRKVATDPVAFFADASTLLGGGALLTARAAPSVSNVLARGAAATDPLLQTARLGIGGVNALRQGLAAAPNPREAFVSALRPYVDPDAAAVNRFVQAVEDPAAAARGLQATQNAFVTPGAPTLSASERLIEAGVPSLGVASLEQGLAASSPQVAQQMRARELGQQSAVQQQLARVEQQIQTQAATLAPADLSRLRAVRDDLLRGLAEEQQTLTNTAAGVAQPLPSVSQREVGGQIQQRGADLETQTAKRLITPAYEQAFKASGDKPINVNGAFKQSQRITGGLSAVFDASTAPEAIRKVFLLEPPMAPGEWVPLGGGGGYRLPDVPQSPTLTLREFDEVRKALNREYGAALNSTASDARVRASNLQSVIKALDADLASSGIPEQAKTLYGNATQLFQNVTVPRFRTGETGKMLSEGTFNMPRTLPSEQVSAFLKNEEAAAQFVRTFESDPRALQSMQQGILDLYRREIVNPTTRAVNIKKADKFEADYGRQLDTLEAAGLNVRETMGQVRQDAAAVQRGLEALNAEAKKFKNTVDANAVVDLGLKSAMEMRSVRDRLGPVAREALSNELVNRATTLIERGDAAGALSYLTKNERALKVGLGKENAKTYRELRELAELQKQFLDVSAIAPKTAILTPVTLSKQFTPAELTNLQVVVNDISRTRAAAELGAPKDKGVGKVATEAAAEASASPKLIPSFFNAIVTAGKSSLKSILDIQDRRVAAALFDKLIKDPDSLIPVLEEAARVKAAAPAKRPPPRPLTIPPIVSGAARVGTAASIAGREESRNAFNPQQNQNAMAR